MKNKEHSTNLFTAKEEKVINKEEEKEINLKNATEVEEENNDE